MNSPFGNQNRRDWFRQELPMDSKLAVGKSGKTFIVPRNLLPMCLRFQTFTFYCVAPAHQGVRWGSEDSCVGWLLSSHFYLGPRIELTSLDVHFKSLDLPNQPPKYILTTSFTMEKFPGFYPNQMTKDKSTRANRYYSSPSIAKTQNHCDIFWQKKCISWPYLCRNITWTQTVLLKYWGYEAK